MRPDIEGIRKRAKRATKGPWREGTLNVWNDNLLLCICSTERFARKGDSRKKQQADAQFIAAARSDIPALLAYIAELEKIARDLAAIDPADDDTGGWCVICGGAEEDEYGNYTWVVKHKDDCAWVAARKLMGLAPAEAEGGEKC